MSTFVVFTPAPSVTAARSAPAVALTDVAPRYDPFAKDIAIGPDGEPVFGNPWEALADETLMGILVRRQRYPGFPPDFGNVFDLDARQPGRALQQAAFRADISRQIPYRGDPTIKGVGGFTFAWDSGESLRIGCVVTPAVGPTVPVTVPYPAGR